MSVVASRPFVAVILGFALTACGASSVALDETGTLSIRSHDDEEVVRKDRIRIRGEAPPGAEVVRDISLGPDERTKANPAGKWSMVVELDKGTNELTFRIGDADETAITIDLTYQRRGKGGRGPGSYGRDDAKRQPAVALGEAPQGRTQVATVVSVTDGDTIRVLIDGTEESVRYIGIDAPEVGGASAWIATESTKANASLVGGQVVVLERDVSKRDRYGRLLAYVWLETADRWLLVNRELVRRGFAEAVSYPPNVKYDALLQQAQGNAAEALRGVWGTPPATPEPTPLTLIPQAPASNCEPSYPEVCVQPGLADLDCSEMYVQGISMIRVRYDVPNPDPHGFDGTDNDGWGCEG